MRLLAAVAAAAAVVIIAGCGARTAASVSSVAPIAAIASPTPAAASASPTPAFVSSPAASACTAPASPWPPSMAPGDVGDAEQAALSLFVQLPLVLDCPSHGYVWGSGPSSASHLSAAVKARLNQLSSQGYFSDGGGCGEDYIMGTQNGLYHAPVVLSAVAGADGRVTVVIDRPDGPPSLTAVMTKASGVWLAADLASGSGPNASIFSAKPNC